MKMPYYVIGDLFARKSRLVLRLPHMGSSRPLDSRRLSNRIYEEDGTVNAGIIGPCRFSNLAGILGAFATFAVLPAHAQYSASTVDIGPNPGEVAVNPVTNTIYFGHDIVSIGATWNSITAIDGATNATSAITAGQEPLEVAVNPVTNKIYTLSANSATLTVIDGATNEATTIPIGTYARGIAVNPVTNKIYVNSGPSVTVIDGATNIATTISDNGGEDPNEIAVNSVTNKVYASSFTIFDSEIPSGLVEIDGVTNAVTPVISGAFSGSFAVNPVTNKIYVAGFGNTNLVVVDGITKAATTLNVGPYPSEIVVNPTTNKLCVVIPDSNELTVIDGSTNATSSVTVGNVDMVAVDPVSNKFYVDNADSGTLTVIDAATNKTTVVAVANGTGGIAVNPVTSLVYLTNTNNGTLTVIDGNVPGAPSFASEPESQTVNIGTPVALNAVSSGSTAVTYQWFCNGLPLSDRAGISGASTSTLYLSGGATQTDTGIYNCVATNSAGSTSSIAAALNIINSPTPGRLINLSCRSLVGTGANSLIAGFVVGGSGTTGSEAVLVRASGPALVPFGLNGVLPDPKLGLVSSNSNSLIAANSGWGGNALISSTAAAVGAFSWVDPSSHDSALVEMLPAGPYTAIVAGADGDSGVALAEIYDATPVGAYSLATPRLTNVSARALVGQGANVQIAGFVIGGATSETVLIRASGPALTPFGIAGVLPDPQLQLNSSNGVIASNTGWGGNAQIAAASAAVGAFSWGISSTLDSAILVTLPSGAYTAEVSGASGDSGVALVEIYEVK
jgi:DNA-binding beta-propeller fold protein YncE